MRAYTCVVCHGPVPPSLGPAQLLPASMRARARVRTRPRGWKGERERGTCARACVHGVRMSTPCGRMGGGRVVGLHLDRIEPTAPGAVPSAEREDPALERRRRTVAATPTHACQCDRVYRGGHSVCAHPRGARLRQARRSTRPAQRCRCTPAAAQCCSRALSAAARGRLHTLSVLDFGRRWLVGGALRAVTEAR
jgi:hypothetical protein